LKFDIKDIGPDGLHVDRQLGEDEVRALLQPVELMAALTGATLDVSLARLDSGAVVASGELSARFAVPCGRCLGAATVQVEADGLRLTFLPPAKGEAEREAGLEDVDTFSHDGERVDLGSAVRELMMLAIPMAPLCHPECRGICPNCGADLNYEACRCTAEETGGEKKPWAAATRRNKGRR
jgi:uncharacterized protein